ncbi:DUF2007 domain-containing protein [candidate division TA06 bacterium]|nr:DUF2007 domain-containing protein [candidate division TA06 bacterium]
MKYCPMCRSEYREDFQTCSGCGSPLIGKLPEFPDETVPEAELVPVFDPPEQMIGQSLAALLEDNGIRCILKSEEIPAYAGVAMMLRPRWGRLLVLEGDRTRAQELINEYLSAPEQEGPEEGK